MKWMAVALLMMGTVGCAGGGTGGSSSGARTVITAEEISSVSVGTAYEAVQRLRPEFLRPRGGGAMPVLYVDGVRMGEVGDLRSYTPASILRVEYVSASDATTRWGTGHTGGALEVSTRR